MAKAERPAPVSILYGRRQQEYAFDEYLAAGHLDTIKKHLGGESEVFISEFDLARDSDVNLGEALDLVSTPALWGKAPLVVIREAQIAFAAREEARNRFAPFFERAAALARSKTAVGHLALVARGFEIKKGVVSIGWDKAAELFRAVDKAGWALACVPPYESGLRTILMQHAREKGVRLLPDAADALVAAVGDNQMALIEELGKLIGAFAETRVITAADVERLAAAWPERDAFTFAERIVEGDTAGALALLRDLRQSPATRPLPVIMGALKFKLLQYHAAAAAIEKGAMPEEAIEAAKVFFRSGGNSPRGCASTRRSPSALSSSGRCSATWRSRRARPTTGWHSKRSWWRHVPAGGKSANLQAGGYMRHRILAALVCAVVAGCWSSSAGIVDPEARRRKYPEQPLQIVEKKSDAPATEAAADPTLQPLMEALEKQEEALAQKPAATEPAQQAPAAPVTPVAEQKPAPPVAEEKPAPPSPPAVESTQTVEELSVQHLVDVLAAKPARTPGEEEAYRRLLGMTNDEPPAGAADEYSLLGDAQAAILNGQMEHAQDKANEALAIIRRKTDPRIDRVCLAWQASSYGDAEVVDPAEFTPGQAVLAVTDLSNFACMPVGSDSPPALYYVKMSQRLAIYDKEGKLYWEYAHGPFEYQARHYFSTMFIPVRLTIPNTAKPGEYVLKVEITDVLAGRQSESSASFAVK